MKVRIVSVRDTLPPDFDLLHTDALAEGVANMTRLHDDWLDGRQRFREPASLFAALADDALAGVGGVVPEMKAGEPAMRMSRLFVRPAFRRQGIGAALAAAMIRHGAGHAGLLTVNAGASPQAAPFWQAQGFQPAAAGTFTHILRRVPD